MDHPAKYYYTAADAAKHPQDPQPLHFYHLLNKPTPHAEGYDANYGFSRPGAHL
jgi:hypothetical protein